VLEKILAACSKQKRSSSYNLIITASSNEKTHFIRALKTKLQKMGRFKLSNTKGVRTQTLNYSSPNTNESYIPLPVKQTKYHLEITEVE
jgi:hypothetical protein